jgi:hypothetical protein
MNHLHEGTKKFLESCSGKDGDIKKIKYIESSFWIPYTVANSILTRMEEILNHPRTHRMPDLLIIARTNNGKTSLLKRFVSKHKAVVDDLSGDLIAKVIAVVTPHHPTESFFTDELLKAVNIRIKASEPFRIKLDQVYTFLESLQVKVILLDEIQHLGAAGYKQQRLVMNMIKNLSSILGISFIAAGTPEALNIFSADDQLANRFKPVVIPKWTDDHEYKKLLASFEALLPFGLASDLQHPLLANFILTVTDGSIGDIYELLKLASIKAIKSGESRLTLKLLQTCGHMSPSDMLDERKKNL